MLAKEAYQSTKKTNEVPQVLEDVSKVPDWVKNNAKWWAEGQIKENDFLKGIEFMAKNGIINVN